MKESFIKYQEWCKKNNLKAGVAVNLIKFVEQGGLNG